MLNKLMAFTMDLLNIVSWEEAPKATITEALLYALVGFSIVFLGISFLIFVVWLVGKVMSAKSGKKPTKEIAKSEKVEQPTVSMQNEEEISEETIAVITAAIMAYYVKENRKCEFTVKRIKRI